NSDDQLRQISKGGVQQTSHRIAGLRRDGFRRMTQQNSQRQNREHGKNEVQRVRFVVEFLRCQCNGNKHQQPKQWVAADFLKEQLHGTMIQFPQTLAIRNRTKVQWAARNTVGYEEQWLDTF